MTTLHLRVPAAALAVAFLAAGCGSSAPEPRHAGEAPGQDEASEPKLEPPPEDSPWAELDRAELAAMVRRGALDELAERHEGFDEAMLQRWIDAPDDAPRLQPETAAAILPLVLVAFVEEDWTRVEGIVALVRKRSENRHMAFVAADMVAEAARRRAGDDPEAQRRAIRDAFEGVPIPRIGEAARGVTMFPSMEVLQAALDSTYRAEVSHDSASAVLLLGHVLPSIVSRREMYMEVLGDFVESQAQSLQQTYDFPSASLAADEEGAEPVVVAVWDVGTKTELFEGRLFDNPDEEENGEDDDGNGHVDDIHGIVSNGDAPDTDLHYEPEHGTVEARKRLGLIVGVQRLQSGLEFLPGAREAAQLVSQIRTPDQRTAFENTMGELMEWIHGTHVAGSMLEGNPHARLAVFRSTWAGAARAKQSGGPTDEDLAHEHQNLQDVAEFINAHDVRVVTIGLDLDQGLLMRALSQDRTQFGDAQAVKDRAAAVQAERAEHWREVFEACPRTLFVVGAGNESVELSEAGLVPASLEAPNLLPVGALDPWGQWAVFTNFGRGRVELFDRGVEVNSVVPTGDEMPLSGTAQAAPLVAGLAAKMLALDPSLEPAEIRQILVQTGDVVEPPFTGRIPNDATALEKVRAGLAEGSEGGQSGGTGDAVEAGSDGPEDSAEAESSAPSE